MFHHVILGCLRDGQPRHGYDVWIALRALERTDHDDARRHPYGIHESGCRAFDAWLASHATHDDEFSAWLSFIDHVVRGAPPSARTTSGDTVVALEGVDLAP